MTTNKQLTNLARGFRFPARRTPGLRSTNRYRNYAFRAHVSALFLLYCLAAQAQPSPTVPDVIRFADQRLELTADARKKIQTDVDALTRYEKYFRAKVERVDAYFPLIEAVLREEKVPEDVKYLVIQESALVGDAVSSSNAVGYWQFKRASAEEVGLTISGAVDERMNIITATRGAARYLKKNNAYFDNWLYALMAYYEGPGGALKKVDESQYGARKMRLRGNTHWYVLKYLSHKIAFESAVGQDPSPPVQLTVHTDQSGKTLAEIAREFDLEAADLEPYNRWLRQRRVPNDKPYPVIVPRFSTSTTEAPVAQRRPPQRVPQTQTTSFATQPTSNPTYFAERRDTEELPMVEEVTRRGEVQLRVNGLPGIVARPNEDIRALAQRSGVSSSQLVRYNDLTNQQAEIEAGHAYYLRPKRNRALAHYHTVAPGESLWSVSQRLGIKMKKLMRNNRMREEEPLKPGRVLWTRFIRPERIAVEYRPVPAAPNDPPLPATQEVATEEVPEDPWRNEAEADLNSEATLDSPAPSEPNDRPRTVVVSDESPKGSDTTEEDAVWRAEDVPEQHTVAPGETLYSIARQYQLSPKQLAKYNDIEFGDALKAGQTLRTKPPAGVEKKPTDSPAKQSVHEVQAGETMFQIARNYGITIKELMEWNNKDSFELAVGEVLRISR